MDQPAFLALELWPTVPCGCVRNMSLREARTGFIHDSPARVEAVGPEAAEDRTCWLGCPKGPSVIGDSDVRMESEGGHLWRNRSCFSQGEGSA